MRMVGKMRQFNTDFWHAVDLPYSWARAGHGELGRTATRWLRLLWHPLSGVSGFYLLVGLITAQVSLAVRPEAGVYRALGDGIWWMLTTWMLVTGAGVVLDLVRGGGQRVDGQKAPALSPNGQAAMSVDQITPTIAADVRPRFSALQISLAAVVLMAAALQRTPSRLVVNLMGFGLVAAPLLWVVTHRAGPRTAARAALILAIFSFYSTHVELTQAPGFAREQAASTFRWTVGWVNEEWRLRYDVGLERPAEARPMVLAIPLAAAYTGPAQVIATMNQHELGPARLVNLDVLKVDVPASLVAGQTQLTFELHQQPVDTALRLMAVRWTGSASMGAAASSFYDTERWWPGTFNDAIGRRQSGMFLAHLEWPEP